MIARNKENDISHWRLDKRIPLAIVITLFFQIIATTVWATRLDSRVVSLEEQKAASLNFGEKLARIEERINAMQQDTNSIKHEIENLTNKLLK